MTINEIQDEIIEEFALFDDWMDKYEQIIDEGKALVSQDKDIKIEANLVRGCQSKVWLDGEEKDGKLILSADSDAIITKGLIALMIRVLSNHTPQEIISSDLYFVDKIGLKEHLSPTRSNGLVSMIKKIKLYALAFESKNK